MPKSIRKILKTLIIPSSSRKDLNIRIFSLFHKIKPF
ncbi:MAG: hypothetical protein ACI97N_002054 [Cognaticolwellia sp.]